MKALGYPEAQKTDLPLLQPASPPAPIDQGPVRFLFASSIIPTKGPDRLVDAFLSIQEDATLSIAGHAPAYPAKPGYAENLQNRVRSQPNIRWLGPIPAENMPQLMADHDVLVLPSIWPENSPLVVREATAEGLQVVASAIGGSHELAPSALLIGNDLELRTALSSLAKGGRVRLPRTTWPTPSEHADLLLEQAYTGTRA